MLFKGRLNIFDYFNNRCIKFYEDPSITGISNILPLKKGAYFFILLIYYIVLNTQTPINY